MRWMSPLIVVTVAAAVVGGAFGCGTPPQSEELQELEQKLRADESQELRQLPNAARYHEDARRYRRAAEEAREERRMEHSREYAKLGLLRYNTAVAVYEQFQVVDEVDEINERINEVNPKIREITSARNELAEEIRQLDGEIREAVQQREEQRLAQMREQEGGFDPASGDDGAQDAELLEEANEMIAEAERLRDSALEHDADEYPETRGLFDRAETQLENAREMVQDSPSLVRTAKRQLGFAVQVFEEVNEQVVPIHEAFVEKMRPENRIDALRTQSTDNFTADFVKDEPGGARIILARLFTAGEEDFEHGTDPMIDTLADIVDEFEEFDVTIQGHTQRQGGATEARTLSQARAQRVQDRLQDAGIDTARVSHEGEGFDNIRFQDSADNNDRVEVILRHEDY